MDVLDDVFRGTEAVALGLVTWDRLSGPRFRRLFPDVYLPADRECDLAVRSRAAYRLVGGGAECWPGTRRPTCSAPTARRSMPRPRHAPAEVLLPRTYRPRPGLVIRYGRVLDHEVGWAAGCLVTSPSRTAWDLARRLPLVEAVVAVDALARRGGFQPPERLPAPAPRTGSATSTAS